MLNNSVDCARIAFRVHRSFFFLLLFYCVLATTMLGRYPRVWVDEPWESITGYTLGAEGKMYNPVLENYSGFDKVFLQPRLVLSLVLAPVFGLFGVGPVAGRFASVLCGALLLIAVYRLSLKFFSRRAAILAQWLVMIETMMFIAYRTIRPEIYLATIECFSLLLLLEGIQRKSLRHLFWSGLLAGIALWTHPNAILYIASAALLFFRAFKTKALFSRYSWTFAGAAILGLLPYCGYVIVNDAHNSFATFFLQLDNRTGAIAQQSWIATSIRGEWNRVIEFTQFPFRVFIVFAYIGAWMYALLSKRRILQDLALVVALQAFLSVLLIANKTVLYTTSVLPLLCILAAAGIDEWLGEAQPLRERLRRLFYPFAWKGTAAFAVLVVLSLNQIAGDVDLLWRNRNCSYAETLQRLQSVIPADARVWGSITFWFGFSTQPMRTQYTRLREVDTFKPEFMIAGDTEVWGKDFWKPVREKADSIIQTRGTLVRELPQSCYGTLRVYRMRW